LVVLNDLTNASAYNIMITNSLGFVMKKGTSGQPSWQASVSDLLPGTYLVKVYNSKDQSLVGTTKFVKL
ncbi:MAG TPA: T9SS type A sorting domain-containing protein, partial [Bacteroidia bacterium]|nr:T9SS type A sorting domain-containing protein [Bacteroidia bacterium]